MTKILDEVLDANAKYAENFGDKANLALPPSLRFAILTCMATFRDGPGAILLVRRGPKEGFAARFLCRRGVHQFPIGERRLGLSGQRCIDLDRCDSPG